jgi:hypothetical protein
MFDVGCINSCIDWARVCENQEKPETNAGIANAFCVTIITCIPVHLASVETVYDC